MPKNWSKRDEALLRQCVENATKVNKRVDMKYIASLLHRPEEAVYLKAYRMHLPLKPMCQRPTMRWLMESKFGDITLFVANRTFYQSTGISQKRWPDLLYGYAEPTQDELERVSRYLHIDHHDWSVLLSCEQLKLF